MPSESLPNSLLLNMMIIIFEFIIPTVSSSEEVYDKMRKQRMETALVHHEEKQNNLPMQKQRCRSAVQ